MSKIRAGILSAASPLPAAFDAATYVASALVDQNWAGLGGTPGAWTVINGVPDYNVDGVTQGDGDTVIMELDISGMAEFSPPGWLLVIAKYNDFYFTNFNIQVGDVLDNYLKATVTGDGATATNGTSERNEDGGVNCTATIPMTVTLNPTANTIYFGAASVVSGGQVAEGTVWMDNDADGLSFGLFSGDPCTDSFVPTPADKVTIVIGDLATPGDTTIVRTLFWNTRPPDSAGFEAVAAFLGWTP